MSTLCPVSVAPPSICPVPDVATVRTMHRSTLRVGHYKGSLTRCTKLRGRCIASRHFSNTTYNNASQDQGGSLRNAGSTPGPASSTPSRPPDLENIGAPPTNFAKPTLTALNFWWRFAKFSFVGIAVLVGGTFAGLEGAHYWVEYKELAAPSDPDGELEKWSWLKEAERWTGGAKGGTDPALGRTGRYALRSAWIVQNWGTGTQIISSNMLANAQQSGEKALEASLEYAHDFYSLALTIANKIAEAGKPLRPETIPELLAKKAATLERIGSRGALYDARQIYERVWDDRLALGSEPDERARLALKLGDVSARLGDTEEARVWWAQALHLVSSADVSASRSASDIVTTLDNTGALLKVPERLPDSPHAQRTLAATLSSLSANYAQSGQLTDAKSIQDVGIALLAPSIPAHTSSTATGLAHQKHAVSHNGDLSPGKSAPQTLHELYLRHRLSLLVLHRAEVNHALSPSSAQTLEELAKAAVEAEDIVFALTSSHPASRAPSTSLDTPIHKALLDDNYAQNRTLQAPASSLLRDARRTALHAWTLSGILHENAASSSSSSPYSSAASSTSSWKSLLPSSTSSKQSENQQKTTEAEQRAALRCYTRALAWAGASSLDSPEPAADSDSSREGVPAPSPSREMLPGEWNALWKGYVRTREAVLASATSGTAAAAAGGSANAKAGNNEKKH